MKKNIDFTEKEQKIRKQWLYFFIACLIYGIFNTFIFSPTDQPQGFLDFLPLNIYLLVSLAITIAMAAIQYHCAYRTYGTRLLTFFIWCDALFMISLFAIVSFKLEIIPKGRSPISAFIVHLIAFVNMILSYRLREVNRFIQARIKALTPM